MSLSFRLIPNHALCTLYCVHDIGFLTEAAVSGPALLQTDYAAFQTFNAVKLEHVSDSFSHGLDKMIAFYANEETP